MSFVCGTDPEFVIKDKEGKTVPAWRFFPDKKNKINVDPSPALIGYNGLPYPKTDITAFRDGYAVEINIPAAECRGNLAGYLLMALKGVKSKLPEGYTLSSLPAWKIDLEDMRDAPEDCQVFGCDPAFNAYTGLNEGVSLQAATHPYRYAGGHMHISMPLILKGSKYVPQQWIFDKKEIPLFVKMLDAYVGLPLTVWFAKPETFERRRYYGKAGEFRFQDYGGKFAGVEYRTPGPEVWNSPVVASFAFGAMRYVAEQFEALKANWNPLLEEKFRNAINTGEGMETLLEKSYISLSGSLNKQEWFDQTIRKDKPFQELAQEFDAGTAVGHMGWDYYHTTLASKKPYVMVIGRPLYGGLPNPPIVDPVRAAEARIRAEAAR